MADHADGPWKWHFRVLTKFMCLIDFRWDFDSGFHTDLLRMILGVDL